MNPAKLGIKSGGPTVKIPCKFGTFNENVMEEQVTVSEVNLCLRQEAADQLFLSAEIKEYVAIAVEVLLQVMLKRRQKCM
jgi:hypothetical protein